LPFLGWGTRAEHAHWAAPGPHGFLGPAYAPFKPDGPGLANLTLRNVTREQLSDRRRLMTNFDRLRREMDAGGMLAGTDANVERALGVLTSSKLLDASDVSQEREKVRAASGDGKPYQYQSAGAPTVNDQLLMARRLVEAGVRCVTLSYGRWDSHGQNFALVRDHGSKLDQGLTALVEDL